MLIFGVGYYAFSYMINTPFKCYKVHNLSRGSFAYHNLAIYVQAKENNFGRGTLVYHIHLLSIGQEADFERLH